MFSLSVVSSSHRVYMSFLDGSAVKNPPAMQEIRVRLLGQEGPWRRKWQPTPVFLPGKSHGQRRSLAGYGPWGCKDWTRLSNQTNQSVYVCQCYFLSLSQLILPQLCPQVHSLPPSLSGGSHRVRGTARLKGAIKDSAQNSHPQGLTLLASLPISVLSVSVLITGSSQLAFTSS